MGLGHMGMVAMPGSLCWHGDQLAAGCSGWHTGDGMHVVSITVLCTGTHHLHSVLVPKCQNDGHVADTECTAHLASP